MPPADLLEVSLRLAAEMLLMGNVASTHEEAIGRCQSTIADGTALERFRRVVVAQGGDGRVCDDPAGVLPRATRVESFRADRDGFLTSVRAWSVGQASMLLGAGRSNVVSRIDPAAGIVLHKKVGDVVAVGDVIADFHLNETHDGSLRAAIEQFTKAIESLDAPGAGRTALFYAGGWVESILNCSQAGAAFLFRDQLVDPAGPVGFVSPFACCLRLFLWPRCLPCSTTWALCRWWCGELR